MSTLFDSSQTNQFSSTFIGLGRNRVINGAFRFSQRNGANTVIVGGGGFQFGPDMTTGSSAGGTTGAFSIQATTNAAPGFQTSVQLACTTAQAVITAGTEADFRDDIEGYNISDFGFGSAGAKSITLSFWVRSSLTGTYCIALQNNAQSRSYVAEYVINAANTWEYKTITAAGDSAGSWFTNNNVGLRIRFCLAAGTTFQTTANSWQGGNFFATSNQANFLSSNSSRTLDITGIQLEIGTVATPYEYKFYGLEQQMCQRYYEKTYDIDTVPGTVTALGLRKVSVIGATTAIAQFATDLFTVPKRIAPTMTGWSPNGVLGQVSVLGQGAADVVGTFDTTSISTRTVEIRATAVVGSPITVNNIYQIKFHWVADASL